MVRRTVIEMCREANHDLAETVVPVADLAGADEVFLTSTAGGIIPVTRIEGRPVGDGRPGPVTQRLRRSFWERKEAGWLGEKIDYDD
jgi:branched-chain amino acid aminotransferase